VEGANRGGEQRFADGERQVKVNVERRNDQGMAAAAPRLVCPVASISGGIVL